MQIKTSIYVYPPRPKTAIPIDDAIESFTSANWAAQYKFNGSRCLIKITGNVSGGNPTIELWNRHAERFRDYTAPDWLIEQCQALASWLELTDHTLLDGELLDKKHAAIKDTIVVWDILILNGDYLLGTTYQERYNRLTSGLDQHNLNTPFNWSHPKSGVTRFGRVFPVANQAEIPHIFVPDLIPRTKAGEGKIEDGSGWREAWATVNAVNAPYTIGTPKDPNYSIKPILEGLMLKDMSAPLEIGFSEKNNGSWMIRSRVPTGRHLF